MNTRLLSPLCVVAQPPPQASAASHASPMTADSMTTDAPTNFYRLGEPYASFYRHTLAAFLLWHLIVRLLTRRHLWSLPLAGAVLTRPSWLPLDVFLEFCKLSSRVLLLTLYSALLFGSLDQGLEARAAVAIFVTLYHLYESAATSRHGEYPLLYISWAMLLPPELAHGAAWGAAIHFILQSGAAKLRVGGAAWLGPRTMAAYLNAYRDSRDAAPLSRAASAWIASRAWATSAISGATVLLEIVLIPATLLAPAAWRPAATAAMVCMHCGILVVMSRKVGIVFITSLPCYVVGFSCRAAIGSAPWAAAAILGLLPTVASAVLGVPLPEDWPSSSISLFMWNGAQAERLSALLMTGDTRVVLSARRPPQVGDVVAHSMTRFLAAAPKAGDEEVVHDCVLRLVGYTLAHATPVFGAGGGRDDGWLAGEGAPPGTATQLFLARTDAWLRDERRLVERSTGAPLRHSALVRVGGEAPVRVVEVVLRA